MPAKLPQCKRGTTAQVLRHINTIAYGHIRATPRQDLAEPEHLPGFHVKGTPHRALIAIQRDRGAGPGQRHHRIGMKLQRWPVQRGFKPGRTRVVAHQAVGNAKRKIVHRARRRHPNVPVPFAPGVVLHAGGGSRLDNLEHTRLVDKIVQKPGAEPALGELRGRNQLAQVIQIGGNAMQPGLCQCHLHGSNGLRAGGPVNNQFGQHRVVKRRDLGTGRHPAVHTYRIRKIYIGQRAWRRLELLEGVFGIQSHFNCSPTRGLGQSRPIQWLGCRHPQHAFDQIQPGYRFGHRMLNLQPCVHFQKIKCVAGRVIDELDRTGTTVIDRFTQHYRSGMQGLARSRRQARRRGFFNQLLVAPLNRTVTLAQRHHPTAAITKNLYFHMTGVIDETFKKHPAVTEKRLTQPLHAGIGTHQILRCIATRQANTTTACRGFKHDRVRNAFGGVQGFIKTGQQACSRRHGNTGRGRQLAGTVFQAKRRNLRGGWADKDNAMILAGLAKRRTFRQKTITGKHRLSPGFKAGGNDFFDIQVGIGRTVPPQRNRCIGQFNMV